MGTINTTKEFITSCAIFDALDKLKLKPKVLNLDIKPLNRDDILFGQIFTLKGISNISDEQKKASRVFFEELNVGNIIMIETGNSYGVGHWGELMSHAARIKGIKGVIFDGGCRDSSLVIDMGMPVFCKYTSPFESGSEYCIGDWQTLINMPGMKGDTIEVNPGNYVVADADGIIVFDAENCNDILRVAEEVFAKERQTIIDMAKGMKINEAFIKNGVV